MRRPISLAVLALTSSLALAHWTPDVARACGGCFRPGGMEQVSVVTDHRMVVSMSQDQTTLWDQILYSGAPEDFVWVLPVASPDTQVELASNAFFDALEQATAPIVQGPPTFAGGGGSSGDGFLSCGGDDSAAAAPSAPPQEVVTVHSMTTVGPFETSTISSESPTALIEWLQAHGYSVPDATQPIIEHYVSQHMAFVALRLRPGAGVQAMQPVRVTVPGLSATFPLRMIGAGVAEKVGLTLWIFAEGRYEAANFPNATIDASRLTWSTATSTSNYGAVFGQTIADRGGRAWVTEYSAAGAEAVATTTTAADLAVATRGIRGIATITRLRTSLAASFLDEDLTLQAASSTAAVSRFYQANATSTSRMPMSPILVLGALAALRGLASLLRRRRQTGLEG